MSRVCLDDCSRKVASRWSERKRSVDVLSVLEDWIIVNGKPKKIMHDNGKQFTSRIFRHFLVHNHIKDKQIPNSYPQLQGKVEAYNKIALFFLGPRIVSNLNRPIPCWVADLGQICLSYHRTRNDISAF
jgi:transposase InsO family protein